MSDVVANFLNRGRDQGIYWYGKLSEVPSRRGIILRYEAKLGNAITHKFAHFETPVQIFNYIKTFPSEIRCFHEVVEGSRDVSKMRFDIDADNLTPEMYSYLSGEVLYSLICAIYAWNPSLKIIIYTSCCPYIRKVSYHVILPEVVGKHHQLSKLYKEIVSRVPIELHKYIDEKVYSSVKSLRMAYSTKPGETRYKVPLSVFQWKDLTLHFPYRYTSDGQLDTLTMFEDSLLNCCNDTKVVLTYPEPEEKDDDYTCTASEAEIIAMAKVEGNFKFRSRKGNIYNLDNIDKSRNCSVCNRKHGGGNADGADNAYLKVERDGTVKFKCFRDKEGRFRIVGKVNVNITGTVGVSNEPIIQQEAETIYKPRTSLLDLISLARNDVTTYKRYT